MLYQNTNERAQVNTNGNNNLVTVVDNKTDINNQITNQVSTIINQQRVQNKQPQGKIKILVSSNSFMQSIITFLSWSSSKRQITSSYNQWFIKIQPRIIIKFSCGS